MRVPFFNTTAAFCLFAALLGTVSAFYVPGGQHGSLALSYGVSGLWSWPSQTLESIWRTMAQSAEKARSYASSQLEEAKDKYKDVSDNIDNYKSKLDEIVIHAKEAIDHLKNHDIDMDDLTNRLSRAGAKVIEELKEEFEEPLPEDMDERALKRAKMLSRAFDKMGEAYVAICTELNVPEEVSVKAFGRIRPPVESALLIAGGIIDRHPELVIAIIISAVFLVFPAAPLVRFLFQMVGFGPTGPIKGSAAALLQRFFFGAAVPAGSWFSWLQRAGMTGGLSYFFKAILRAILALIGL